MSSPFNEFHDMGKQTKVSNAERPIESIFKNLKRRKNYKNRTRPQKK